MGRFKSKLDTLRQTYRLSRLGGMPEPKWLAPFIRLNRRDELNVSKTKIEKTPEVRKIEFPEDRYIQSFYDRFPLARLQPIELDSFEPPPVKKMAVKQLHLVQQGVPQKKAQRIVEQEMFASGELKIPTRPSIIAQIQAEEERILMAAIQQRKRNKATQSSP